MTFTWTPEAITEATRLYVEGRLSAAQIGDILGTTKMSVIGKMNRLCVVSPRTKADNVPPRAIREPKPAKLARLPPVHAPQKPVEPAAALPAPVAPPEPVLRLVSHGKTIIHLSARECRFPVGENDLGEHTFCAAPTEPGSPYCPACRKIVYAPTNYKPKIGHTAGRRFG